MRPRQRLVRNAYWPLAQKIKGESAARLLPDLLKNQWLSRDELLKRQWRNLQETVNDAIAQVPYYRQLADEIGWDKEHLNFSYADFLEFPILSKETVRDRIDDFLNPHYLGRKTEGATSGSTGMGLPLYYSTKHESFSEAARWRAKMWYGVDIGAAHVALWGRPYTGRKDRAEQIAKSLFMNTLLLSAFDLRKSKLKLMWPLLRLFSPDIIYAYPSAVFRLAEYLMENGIKPNLNRLKVIMVTSESSTIDQRRTIEKVFKCPTANEYGCSETGGFVYECPDGGWHISPELTFIEFLDDRGQPVSQGENGHIVLTHLCNEYMPLIRYKVGDIGSPGSDFCPCGRGLPLMDVKVAKESDRIVLGDGNYYMSGDFLYIHKAVMASLPDTIRHFRIIQHAVKQFDVEIVKGLGEIEKGKALFSSLMREQIGRDIQIRFVEVNEIARDPTGKLYYFKSMVNEPNR